VYRTLGVQRHLLKVGDGPSRYFNVAHRHVDGVDPTREVCEGAGHSHGIHEVLENLATEGGLLIENRRIEWRFHEVVDGRADCLRLGLFWLGG